MKVSLKHEPEALEGKSVRFRIRGFRGDPPEEVIADGKGTLHISPTDEDGKFETMISVDIWPESGIGTAVFHHLPLEQSAADSIRFLQGDPEGIELECRDSSLPDD